MEWNNSSGYITFLRRIIIFSIVLGILSVGLRFLVPARFITPTLPLLFLFFIGVTLTGFYFILQSSKDKFIRFVNAYLLVTVIKLFLFVGIIFFYLLRYRQDAAAFAISFFILYVSYTIFEVVNLVTYFKPTQK